MITASETLDPVDNPLFQELKDIASGDPNFIGTLQVVEIAFSKIPSLQVISKVHNLIELTLLHTSLPSLRGIEAIGHSLQRLTVISGCCEPSQQLQNFESVFLELHELRFLNLGENHISKIENLTNCTKLEQLFLYHNAVKKIEGLENCLRLEELNLSCNKIRKVENIGNMLVNLRILMLSANKIEYFEDINEISQLPRLQKLSFGCENFGECPVTEINNYREYVLS